MFALFLYFGHFLLNMAFENDKKQNNLLKFIILFIHIFEPFPLKRFSKMIETKTNIFIYNVLLFSIMVICFKTAFKKNTKNKTNL